MVDGTQICIAAGTGRQVLAERPNLLVRTAVTVSWRGGGGVMNFCLVPSVRGVSISYTYRVVYSPDRPWGAVAQWLEHPQLKQEPLGSIPSGCPGFFFSFSWLILMSMG